MKRAVHIYKTNRKVKVSPHVLDPLVYNITNIDDYFTTREIEDMFWHFRKKDKWWYGFVKHFKNIRR